MKNKSELFLKYLDDQLSSEEKKIFEESLKNNFSLNEEFQKYAQIYYKTLSEIEVDERYFNNLLPRARKRIKRPINKFKLKYTIIIPIAILAFLVIYFNSGENLYYDFNNILKSFTSDEKLAEELFENSFENWHYLYEEDFSLSLFSAESLEVDESFFEYLSYHIRSSDINENLLNKISEEEFNEVYKGLKEKKYIGEK